MTRTPLRIAVLGGGALVIAAAIAGWLISPTKIPLTMSPASAPRASSAFNFTAAPTPRPLPELRFTDAVGRKLTLGDFRGRLVLLNLWATWCVPCRKEMPALDRLQARLGGPGFEVVALSIDRKGLSAVQPFYQELGLQALRIYVEQSGEAADELGAPGLPTTLLIDRNGRELSRVVGPAEWDSPPVEAMVRRYLAVNPAEPRP
jgi:thiol-disulfide isomerase/thioredoxin